MKKSLIIFAVLLFGVTSTFAEINKDEPICKAMDGYKMALKSENPGLRLNALYQIAQIKSMYPEMNFAECSKHIKKLVEIEKNPRVKVQANLALAYLNENNLAKTIKMAYKEPPVDFFKRVYEGINSTQIALN
jgi:hypothetical protein